MHANSIVKVSFDLRQLELAATSQRREFWISRLKWVKCTMTRYILRQPDGMRTNFVLAKIMEFPEAEILEISKDRTILIEAPPGFVTSLQSAQPYWSISEESQHTNPQDTPVYRKLRGYAFDPSLSLLIDTVDINDIVYEIDWEDKLEPGPSGEYVEVVDYDPTIDKYFIPVDLNTSSILANDGLAPSEGNPQFHQQMVYTVAMITIRNFEKALGRKILWAPHQSIADSEYVQQLRIYPHALRDANAFYSPFKKALLFGYFSASPRDRAKLMPGSLVFTCLSHDIIAHEVTHAILDGIHPFYNRPSNPDILAFHEAFADIVALFQHFTFPEVLRHQIARTKGNLEKQNLLGQLAQQFGTAIGHYGSLRDALGKTDPQTKEWIPKSPDPREYQEVLEPHERGSILVAAVFEAFLNIYKRRVADLLRISTGGTGVLPEGEIHPDLVNRLADEAAKAARHVLAMCIRAIDYCPPVDITFGDFLRAIITADSDIVPDDYHYYRLAFVDAFRRRGIYPEGIQTLSVESLRYRPSWMGLLPDTQNLLTFIGEHLRQFREQVIYEKDRKKIFEASNQYIFNTSSGLQDRLWEKFDNSYEFEKLTGLIFNSNWEALGAKHDQAGRISYQIWNLRLVSRVGPDGDQINQIVFNLVQSIGVIYENGEFKGVYNPEEGKDPPPGGFEVQGGCTLIFDLDTVQLKYASSKPLLVPEKLDSQQEELNQERIKRQYLYRTIALPLSISEVNQYFASGIRGDLLEPFALLHNG